jgi:Zn-dependent oligopeptidase
MNYMLCFSLKDINYQQEQLQLVKEEEFAMEDERISIYFHLQTMLLTLDRLLPVHNCQLLD